MQRKFRLRRSEDFQRVRQLGRSYAHPLVVLIVHANDEMTVRVGVATARTVGSAVKRNRAKRLLREAMRSLLPLLPAGWDMILIARPALLASPASEIRQALLTLLRRAKLISADAA